MKPLPTLLVLLTMIPTLVLAQPQVRPEDQVGQVLAISEGTGYRGSCTVVSGTILATCYHCVQEAQTVTCVVNGTAFFATVTSRDPRKDIAFLRPLEGIDLEAPYIDNDYTPEAGDRLIAYGFTTPGQPLKKLRVTVTSPRFRDPNNLLVVGVKPPFLDGMSGGGVFTNDGDLVGIIQAKFVRKNRTPDPNDTGLFTQIKRSRR